MALTTYAELQTSVAAWLHHSNTSLIADFISLGEERIFRDLRCRQMETALSGTISSGVMAVPSDYKELKFAYIDGTPIQVLQKAASHQVYARYPYRVSDSIPQTIARDGANFVFGPYPDSSYSVRGIYYAKPESVATSATFLVLFPSLFLFASLCEGASYVVNDERIGLWESKYQTCLEMANSESRKEDASGGGLQVIPA